MIDKLYSFYEVFSYFCGIYLAFVAIVLISLFLIVVIRKFRSEKLIDDIKFK